MGGRVLGASQGYREGAGDRKADAGWYGIKPLLDKSKPRREFKDGGPAVLATAVH